MTMKQNKEKFDFKAFGQAIKAARKAKGISRNQLAEQEKSTRRRQLDTMLDGMSEKDLKILSATAKGIEEANNDETGE